jgi:hypothetical protein
MSMRFTGTLKALKSLLAGNGVYGSWEDEPNGVHMMRCPSGGIMHWSKTRGTLWCQGRNGPRLAKRIAVILHAIDDG